MWPFKRAEISYYRVKKLGTKYYVQRKLPSDLKWTTLHDYGKNVGRAWYMHETSQYKWEADSLQEARDKISEFVPEYFEPFERDSYYY